MKNHFTRHSFSLFLLLSSLFLLSSCVGSPEETLEKIAKDTRSTCPQIIDEYTTMVDSKVLPNRTLAFTYSVKGVYTEVQKRQMTDAMKVVLIQRLKDRKELEFYLINNVRFEHIFLDLGQNKVMHVNIEALDYK